METMASMSPEEMQKLVEKARRELEETLAKMTPEERAAAEQRAQEMIAKDREYMDALIAQAAAVCGGTPKAETRPKFCRNCGAPAGGGKFCTNCGSPLF